ncbi:MAG: dihydrofolate reductase family protein [Alphaproteobacteria bacterium]|nr:dihydrofolate reductase family protein [Alphaproteobacteria bacterium]
MGTVSVTMFQSLDGVVQAPGGAEEDTSGGFAFGGWFIPHADARFFAFIVDVFARPQAFLLGRATYAIFAGYWPQATDPDDVVARALNGLPKFVASTTLERADWAGTTIVRDVAAALDGLKARFDGELQVHGSPGLAANLLAMGAVDTLNLVTVPVLLGRGKRLFDGRAMPSGLRLDDAAVSDTGVVLARYVRDGGVRQGEALPPPV